SEVPQGEPNLFVSPDSNWRLLGVIVYVVKNIQGAVDALAIKEAAAV
ncbi:MAG TPA: peptidase S24, partial [Sutterellaceae bacterium]|nr:peptidase S24 [Sutterellaceae bacterium]